MMKKSSRSLIFMGDFYFLFYIVLLENINKLNYLGIYISAILMAISILGISYFLYFISKMKDFQKIERTVQSLDDRTNLYVMYRYLKVTTKEGSEIFIIASKDEEIQIGDKLSIYMLTDYIYYLP